MRVAERKSYAFPKMLKKSPRGYAAASLRLKMSGTAAKSLVGRLRRSTASPLGDSGKALGFLRTLLFDHKRKRTGFAA